MRPRTPERDTLVGLTVNGRRQSVAVGPCETLLEVLRDRLGLTGTKSGCDKGDCGACTILLDGQPALACLTLAATCEGRQVRTVEGLVHEPVGRRIARALDAEGALQCGFCQPGVLASAVHLLEESPSPTQGQIDAALAGNLCRCTGYLAIGRAIQRAATGDDGPAGQSEGAASIGAPMRRPDALARLAGETPYTADLSAPGMLHCALARSPVAHGRLRAVHLERALALQGVVAAVTGADLPIRYGIIPWTEDEQALATDRVRHVGEPIAAVAAIDARTAREAAALITADIEVLEPLLDPQVALDRRDLLIHPDRPKSRERGNATQEVELSFQQVAGTSPSPAGVSPAAAAETLSPRHHEAGSAPAPAVSAGSRPKATSIPTPAGCVAETSGCCAATARDLAGAPVSVTARFTYAGSTHAPIEPHATLAVPDAFGRLTVHTSTQVPHYVQRTIARVLGLEPSRVRVVQPPVGGAFGGKSDPFGHEICAAALALKTGRPVKIVLTREEVFYAHRGRHPMTLEVTMGAGEDGAIRGLAADILLDGGAYASYGLVTTYYAGQLLGGPYRLPRLAYRARRAYTNKPPCGPKRGHGAVQARFAAEIALDMLAERLRIDPIALRRRHALAAGDVTVNGFAIGSSGLCDCLTAVERASGWTERHGRLPYGQGLGVAASFYISGTNYPIYPFVEWTKGRRLPNDMPQSAAIVKVDRSGEVLVTCGASEIGQGQNALLCAIVAGRLGLDPLDVRVVTGDTTLCPVDLGAYSSRGALMTGTAALEAADAIRARIIEAAAAYLGTEPGRLSLEAGEVFVATDPARRLLFREAAALAEGRHGPLVAGGAFRTTPRGWDYRGGSIGASPAYSFSAHVAQVTVDPDTGRVRVDKVWAAHDCGRALQPQVVRGQIEGCVAMGIGEALWEEHAIDSRGLVRNASLLDYRLQTSLDRVPVEVFIIETPDANGPLGAKEAGEGPIHSTLPAIANAIHDAVGIRVNEIPFRPEVVLAALRAGGAAAETRGGRDRLASQICERPRRPPMTQPGRGR